MMIVDDILNWARGRGYAAVYGSAEQVNEMLNNTPFADSKDGTVVVMHLVTDSATVDGRDRAVVAVYFASLCPFDFDGESLLGVQEGLKDKGKEFLRDVRAGNTMTYSDPRWQYGYDDYAENVCWVCLRVTLTVSAADCVPILPPAPPTPTYDIFCPQIILQFYPKRGGKCPAYYAGNYVATIAVPTLTIQAKYIPWVGNVWPTYVIESVKETITEKRIANWKDLLSYVEPMTEETEEWLRNRIGRVLVTYTLVNIGAGKESVLATYSATNYESKPVTVYE